MCVCLFFFFNDTATTEIYTLSLHDALPISLHDVERGKGDEAGAGQARGRGGEEDSSRHGLVGHVRYLVAVHPGVAGSSRSEEHTSELQSRPHLVCRLLLEKKKKTHDIQVLR